MAKGTKQVRIGKFMELRDRWQFLLQHEIRTLRNVREDSPDDHTLHWYKEGKIDMLQQVISELDLLLPGEEGGR